jgi:adenine phosphoribosyltransferase
MKEYEKHIRVIEGFPKAGISFKDISPLLRDPKALHEAVDDMAKAVKEFHPDYIIGPEARGFVLGAPVAYAAGCGFIMARKKGKLPGEVISESYALEYGSATIELPKFAIKPGDRVVLFDDLMATGGTLKALEDIIDKTGAKVVGIVTLIELTDLKGARLLKAPYKSFIKYPH